MPLQMGKCVSKIKGCRDEAHGIHGESPVPAKQQGSPYNMEQYFYDRTHIHKNILFFSDRNKCLIKIKSSDYQVVPEEWYNLSETKADGKQKVYQSKTNGKYFVFCLYVNGTDIGYKLMLYIVDFIHSKTPLFL